MTFSTGCQNFQTRFQLYFKNNEGSWECSEGWASRIRRAAPGFWSWLHLINAAMWLVVLYNESKNKKMVNPESWPSIRAMPGSQKTYQGPSSTTALLITCDQPSFPCSLVVCQFPPPPRKKIYTWSQVTLFRTTLTWTIIFNIPLTVQLQWTIVLPCI